MTQCQHRRWSKCNFQPFFSKLLQESIHPWLRLLKTATLLFSFEKATLDEITQNGYHFFFFFLRCCRAPTRNSVILFQTGIKCPKPMTWKVFSVYQVLSRYQSCLNSFYSCDPGGDFFYGQMRWPAYMKGVCVYKCTLYTRRTIFSIWNSHNRKWQIHLRLHFHNRVLPES